MKTIFLSIVIAVIVGLGGLYLSAEPQDQVLQPDTATPARDPLSLPSAEPPLKPASRPTSLAVTPNVGTISPSPSVIVVSTPTTVTVTVSITPSPIANGVNMLRLGATGTQPAILGVMHDDGKNGDVLSGDGIYSLQVPFNEPTAGLIQLQASVAFNGLLKRIVSPLSSVSVWQTFSNTEMGLGFSYPATFSATSDASHNLVIIKSAAQPTTAVLTLVVSTQAAIDPDTWFRTQVDQDGLLLASGSVHRQLYPDGSIGYVYFSFPSPDYIDTHGPLPFAIVVSKDGSKVIDVLGSSEGDALSALGYSELQARATRLSVIESIRLR